MKHPHDDDDGSAPKLPNPLFFSGIIDEVLRGILGRRRKKERSAFLYSSTWELSSPYL
jgi:hypothetical protein